MKLSSIFACFSSGSKKAAKKQVQQELQNVASSSPKSLAKDTVVISRDEAVQQVKAAQESLQALAQKKELLVAKQRQHALLTKARSEKNFKLAKKLEAMSLDDFNAFHQKFKQKQAIK